MADTRNTSQFARRLAPVLALAVLAGCCDAGDDVCSQKQADVLGAMVIGGVAGLRPYQQPAPVFVSCTQTGRMVNCIGQ